MDLGNGSTTNSSMHPFNCFSIKDVIKMPVVVNPQVVNQAVKIKAPTAE